MIRLGGGQGFYGDGHGPVAGLLEAVARAVITSFQGSPRR